MARSHEEVVGDEVEGGEAGKRTRTSDKPEGEEGTEVDQDGKAKMSTDKTTAVMTANTSTDASAPCEPSMPPEG